MKMNINLNMDLAKDEFEEEEEEVAENGDLKSLLNSTNSNIKMSSRRRSRPSGIKRWFKQHPLRRVNKCFFLLTAFINMAITIAICIYLIPSCDPISIESEFLFHQYATSDWFPSGLKGDNETGYPTMIVPNIVHYVLLSDHHINFVHYLSIKSVLKIQQPEEIMIHCDCNDLSGEYWEKIKRQLSENEDSGDNEGKLGQNKDSNENKGKVKRKTRITIIKIVKPLSIFNTPIPSWWSVWHASDILRNQALMLYGGIYLDRDMLLIKSLNVFRKYEMTVDCPSESKPVAMGSQIQIAHKNARFLKLYLESYREYNPDSWYFNAGHLPYTKIILQFPHLVHKVDNLFGVNGRIVCDQLYRNNLNWKQMENLYYAVHSLIRGNKVTRKFCDNGNDLEDIPFDEENIKKINNTFGMMSRCILYNEIKIS